jgi:hypothetical protein
MANILVWDLETIPDLKGFAAAHGHDGKTEDEIREALGDKFPKHIFHSIVCIGALIAHQDGDRWVVDALARSGGIAWIMLLYLASGIFAICSNRIGNITTRLAPTYRWARMRRFRGRFRQLAASSSIRSWVDCTINTSGLDFPVGTMTPSSTVSSGIIYHRVGSMNGEDFTALLEGAIERSGGS